MSSLAGPWYPPRARPAWLPPAHRKSDALLCGLLCVYLASLVFEGPVRSGLALAGAASALYIRDAILVASVAFLFLRGMTLDRRVDLLIAVPVALLTLHAGVAVILGIAPFQILFGAKIFLPVVYGMAICRLIVARFDSVLAVSSWIFLVTLGGVALNFFLGKLPWEGFDYLTAFGAVSTTREWTILGVVPRLPGFTRASFDAAMILAVTGTLTMIRFDRAASRAAIAAVALAAIVATTSKGMVLAFALVAAWMLLRREGKPGPGSRLLVYGTCALSLLLPFAVVELDLAGGLPPPALSALLISAWERFGATGPDAMRLLPGGAGAALGAGLGGIGTPQQFGDTPLRFNPGDSLAVFFLVNFGVLGILYLVLPALGLRRVVASEGARVGAGYAALLLLAYLYGLSVNMVEENVFAICFGICLGRLLLAFASQAPRAP